DKLPDTQTQTQNTGPLTRAINSLREMGIWGLRHSLDKGLSNIKVLFGLFHYYALNWHTWFNFAFFFLPFTFLNRNKKDWYLLISFLSVPLLYTIYARTAIMYGPRYMYELLPIYMLIMARGMDAMLSYLHTGFTWIRITSPLSRKTAVIAAAALLYSVTAVLITENIHLFYIKDTYDTKTTGSVYAMPQRIGQMQNFNGLRFNIPDLLRKYNIRKGIVLIEHYKWWGYGSVSTLNSPYLDTDLVFGRNLGPEKNADLFDAYPGKDIYLVTYKDMTLYKLQVNPETGVVEQSEIGTLKDAD
ncbi:hypothetical protein JW979_06060, partial [bacterium]|nr:hypothetical protein [candidate division CSSED10-310 bacterium]